MTDPAKKTIMIGNRHTELEAAAVRLGTQNQQERFAANLLPEEELLGLARAVLFEPFSLGITPWGTKTRVQVNDVKHHKDCAVGDGSDVVFDTTQAGELNHDEWERYREFMRIRDRAALHPWLDSPQAVTLEPIAHFATCRHCEGEACRMSVKVTIEWAGRKLVREYVL
jgi:hypothetical protein